MSALALPVRLSGDAARRIALAAQGFGEGRPAGPVTAQRLRRVLGRLGVLQLDSVNVFCRSHYLPLFARLGPYPRQALDLLAGHRNGPAAGGRRGRPPRRRALVEYWAHEASLIPTELHPLFRWRMAAVDEEAWGGIVRTAKEHPDLVREILQLAAREGPIRAQDTGVAPRERRPGDMWNWHEGKVALEYLFFEGRLGAAERVNFERRYDLIERVLPDSILRQPTPDAADAQRELVRIAARALGVATEPDLG
ncbi:MAG: DNA glycosylase AlkZ-like family protein, partial [Candidatus Dormibacteraceae bacterium]